MLVSRKFSSPPTRSNQGLNRDSARYFSSNQMFSLEKIWTFAARWRTAWHLAETRRHCLPER
jgi:hypothetical protein